MFFLSSCIIFSPIDWHTRKLKHCGLWIANSAVIYWSLHHKKYKNTHLCIKSYLVKIWHQALFCYCCCCCRVFSFGCFFSFYFCFYYLLHFILLFLYPVLINSYWDKKVTENKTLKGGTAYETCEIYSTLNLLQIFRWCSSKCVEKTPSNVVITFSYISLSLTGQLKTTVLFCYRFYYMNSGASYEVFEFIWGCLSR